MSETKYTAFRALRRASGMSQTEFGKFFDIPVRTVQDWESGRRECKEYILNMMKYILIKEGYQL